MARWISQGGYGWGSTLPSRTAQPDLPPVEAWGQSNLDQRPAKSRSPNGEWSSRLPSPRRSAQLIRATRWRLAEYLTRMDFIILDELGYLPFAQIGGQLLF